MREEIKPRIVGAFSLNAQNLPMVSGYNIIERKKITMGWVGVCAVDRCYIKPHSAWLNIVRHCITPFSQMESLHGYGRVQQNGKQITASQTNMIQ